MCKFQNESKQCDVQFADCPYRDVSVYTIGFASDRLHKAVVIINFFSYFMGSIQVPYDIY